MRAIHVVLIAATASAAVLGDGCPKHFPKEMRPLWKCCKVEMNPNFQITDEQEAALDYCFKQLNDSVTDLGTPVPEYDCAAECTFTRLGLMGEDKTLNKEKILKMANDQLHDDFHDTSTKALETCMAKKHATAKCPTGLDGIMQCYMLQFMLDCPARHWSDGLECKETKKLMEKCGTLLFDDPDYD